MCDGWRDAENNPKDERLQPDQLAGYLRQHHAEYLELVLTLETCDRGVLAAHDGMEVEFWQPEP